MKNSEYVNFYNKIAKNRKIHVFILTIIVIIILVNLLGVDFFSLRSITKDKAEELKNIKITQSTLTRLIAVNTYVFMFLFMLMQAKHNRLAAYLTIIVNTFMMSVTVMNIVNKCHPVTNTVAMFAAYLPEYVGVYLYIEIIEWLRPFVQRYRSAQKIKEEVVPLLIILTSIISTVCCYGIVELIVVGVLC